MVADNPVVDKWIIAYSGGIDSQVLLHLMASLRADLSVPMIAVHVNHQLSPNADQWVNHCRSSCLALNIPFYDVVVSATPLPGESPEATARQARYRALSEFVDTPSTVLLTAHHQDDQAETVLLQLMRGAGVNGLSAMPKLKPFAQGFMLRPLLQYSQADLLRYAKHFDLRWIDDESNGDESYDRNFLRHQIMPLLSSRRQGVVSAISRSAAHCAEAAELVEALAVIDYQRVLDPASQQLSIHALLKLSPARQRNVLRYWCQCNALPMPSTKILQQITDCVVAAKPDANPQVQWGGVICQRDRGTLKVVATP